MVYCYSFLIQEIFLFPGHNCGKIAVSNNYHRKRRRFYGIHNNRKQLKPSHLIFSCHGSHWQQQHSGGELLSSKIPQNIKSFSQKNLSKQSGYRPNGVV